MLFFPSLLPVSKYYKDKEAVQKTLNLKKRYKEPIHNYKYIPTVFKDFRPYDSLAEFGGECFSIAMKFITNFLLALVALARAIYAILEVIFFLICLKGASATQATLRCINSGGEVIYLLLSAVVDPIITLVTVALASITTLFNITGHINFLQRKYIDFKKYGFSYQDIPNPEEPDKKRTVYFGMFTNDHRKIEHLLAKDEDGYWLPQANN